MANSKISQLTSLTGANTASDDLLAIVDTSATQTKKITVTEFQQAPVSSGIAYSIVYLNGTKVQATSSGLQFDGSNFYLTGHQYYSNNKTAYYRDSTNTPQAVITYGSDDALYFGQGTTNTRSTYYLGSQHIFYSGASEAMRVSSGNLVVATAAKGITGSSSFSVTIANGAAGNLVDLSTALPAGGSGLVIVAGASAGKATILCQRDQGGYYSASELGTQPRGTYITSITISGTSLRITNSTGASETFSGKVVVLTA